jgi:hypothetical protein
MGERGNGKDRRRQDGERRDDPRPGSVEVLEPVAEPADGERQPKDEDAVREDRADQGGLHELDQAGVQRKEANEELGQVAECRLNSAGARRSETSAELLRCQSNGAGKPGDRQGGQREAENRVPAEKMRKCGGGYQDRVDCQLDPLPPADRATLPASCGTTWSRAARRGGRAPG